MVDAFLEESECDMLLTEPPAKGGMDTAPLNAAAAAAVPSPLARDLAELFRTATEWEVKVHRAVLMAYEVTVKQLSETSAGLGSLSSSNPAGTVTAALEVNSTKTSHPSSNRTQRSRLDQVRSKLALRLRQFGFDAALCRTSWIHGASLPGGDYEFVDITRDTPAGRLRCIVDVDFRSQFVVARPSTELTQCLLTIPHLFVGSVQKLELAVELLCVAMKQSMADQELHLPPWRRNEYMKKKWLSTHVRVVDEGKAGRRGDKSGLPGMLLPLGKGGLVGGMNGEQARARQGEVDHFSAFFQLASEGGICGGGCENSQGQGDFARDAMISFGEKEKAAKVKEARRPSGSVRRAGLSLLFREKRSSKVASVADF